MLDEATSQSKIRLKTEAKFGQDSVEIRFDSVPKFGQIRLDI